MAKQLGSHRSRQGQVAKNRMEASLPSLEFHGSGAVGNGNEIENQTSLHVVSRE